MRQRGGAAPVSQGASGGEEQPDADHAEPDPQHRVELRADAHVCGNASRLVGPHDDDAPRPVFWLPVEGLFPMPVDRRGPELFLGGRARRGGARMTRVLRVSAAVEIGDDVVRDVPQIAVDVGGVRDSDEERTVAFAPNPDRAQEGVKSPLRSVRVDVSAVRHDRVRRRREVLGRRHEEAVVVALCPVHGRQRTSPCEEAERDDPGDHPDDDQQDLADGPSAAPLLGEHGRLRGLLRNFRSWGLRLRLGRFARLRPSLVEPERRVLVPHQEHVGGDARDPAVEPEYKVEDSAWIAGEEERDPAKRTRMPIKLVWKPNSQARSYAREPRSPPQEDPTTMYWGIASSHTSRARGRVRVAPDT